MYSANNTTCVNFIPKHKTVSLGPNQPNAPIIEVDILMSRLRMHRDLSESFVIEMHLYHAPNCASTALTNM